MTPLLTLALVALSTGAALAAPVQWQTSQGGNGHFYELIAPELLPDFQRAIEFAEIAAQGPLWTGWKSYLATVTSAEEWAFLDTVVNPGHETAWLGASDAEEEGVWRWVTGPEAGTVFWTGDWTGTASGYANWNSGEPNNVGDEGENALHGWYGAGWNDIPATYTYAYIVEYSPIPLPATLPLLGAGLAGLGVLRRRKRG